jgi:hypothetical protein
VTALTEDASEPGVLVESDVRVGTESHDDGVRHARLVELESGFSARNILSTTHTVCDRGGTHKLQTVDE